MPLYTYRCSKCQKTQDAIRSISDRKNGPICCNTQTKQILTPTMIDPILLGAGTYQGYQCPITDEYVTSRKQRKEIMKRHDLVEMGDDKPKQSRPDLKPI